MSKLNNIKAVSEMIAGNHRTQTKKTVSFGENKEFVKREVGEQWTDNDGNDEMFWDFRKDKPELWEKPSRSRMLESDSTCRLDHIQLVAGNTDQASDEKHKMEDA